jgi:hypothetical protein
MDAAVEQILLVGETPSPTNIKAVGPSEAGDTKSVPRCMRSSKSGSRNVKPSARNPAGSSSTPASANRRTCAA